MFFRIVLILVLSQFFISSHSDANAVVNRFNVRDFGAVGDGHTKATASIQAAIDSCALDGGQVNVPAGTYLTGSLYLKSGVTLYLSAGALLLASTDISDYKRYKGSILSYTDAWLRTSLIFAEKEKRIAISGEGTIDGQGAAFAVETRKKPDRYQNRPYVIRFIEYRDVVVEGITMQNSAMWMQHYMGCERLRVRGIHVYNHCNKNNDMIDIDGCKDVIISDCFGDTDDDALTLKSTFARPTENVTISNCVLSSHCNAIKMGTESHGGFRNIVISNCVIKPSRHDSLIYGRKQGLAGIVLAIVDGGTLDGVTISNISISGTTVPIYLRLGDRGRIYKEGMERPAVGSFSRVQISNIIATATDSIGCSITGLADKPIEHVSLSNIHIRFKGNGAGELVDSTVPELREHYPESTMFGALPAYGFYIRHVDNISLNNITLETIQPDHRPALCFDNVNGGQISALKTLNRQPEAAVVALHNSTNFMTSQSRPLTMHDLFCRVTGGRSKEIYLNDNILSAMTKPVYLNPDVMPATIHHISH